MKLVVLTTVARLMLFLFDCFIDAELEITVWDLRCVVCEINNLLIRERVGYACQGFMYARILFIRFADLTNRKWWKTYKRTRMRSYLQRKRTMLRIRSHQKRFPYQPAGEYFSREKKVSFRIPFNLKLLHLRKELILR